MAQLILMCNLERLPDWDDAQKNCAFGFNFSVGTSDLWNIPTDPTAAAAAAAAKATLVKMMQPWLWGGIQLLDIYQFKNGARLTDANGTIVPAFSVAWIPSSTLLTDAQFQGLQASLRAQLRKSWDDQDPTNQDALKIIPGTHPSYTLKRDQKKPWPALLGKLSTYPSPIPQSLKISYLFRAPLSAGADAIAAVPVLQKDPFPDSPTNATLSGQQASVYIFAYGFGAGYPTAEARMVACPVPRQSPGVFLDPNSLWLTKPEDSAAPFPDDWLSMLEGRMADAFDLSALIIDYLRDHQQTISVSDAVACGDVAVAAMADIAGPSTIGPPKGTSLVTSLGEPLLETAYANLTRTLTEWKSLLNTAITQDSNRNVKLQVLGNPGLPSVQQVISDLDTLHGLLFEASKQNFAGSVSQILFNVVQRQWVKLFTLAGLDDPTAQQRSAALVGKLNSPNSPYSLRGQMALSHLNRYWAGFIGWKKTSGTSSSARELLTDGFPDYFEYYLCQRLGIAFSGANSTPQSSSPLIPPGQSSVSGPVIADLRAHVRKRAAAIAKFWLTGLRDIPVGSTGATTFVPSQTPHAITVQLDRLESQDANRDPNQNNYDTDLLRRISGLGILIRQYQDDVLKPARDWQCLNMAQLDLASVSGGTVTSGLTLSGMALVPYRIVYRQGLRQACVSYNNAPLGCESPLADQSLIGWFQPDPSANATAPDPLLRHVYSTDGNAKIPRLEYGATYDFAAFAISNCGALPKALATATDISRATTLSFPLTDAKVKPNVGKPWSLQYLRRVPIGPLRFSDPDVTIQNELKVPTVADNVYPRARDVEVLNANRSDNSQVPLILLSGPTLTGPQKFKMKIQVPSTHWDTWERWPGIDDKSRKMVIGDFYRQAKLNNGRAVADRVPLSVDDPAIEPSVYVELSKVGSDGSLSVLLSAGTIDFPAIPPGATGLKSQQRDGISLTINWDDSKEGLDRDNKVITIKKGEVYRLAMWVVVTQKSLGRFDSDTLPTDRGPMPGSSSLVLVSPSYFALEAATDDLFGVIPAAAAAWNRFNVPEVSTEGKIDIAFGGDTTLANVGSVLINRQAWRWQGRNTALHPRLIAPLPANLSSEIQNWEAAEFGDRSATDSLTEAMVTSPTRLPNGSRSFTFTESLRTQSGKADERCLHFRFSLRVVSRYEGLFPPDVQPFTDIGGSTPQDKNATTYWRASFVPCRYTGAIDVPKVRLIVPLTEVSEAGQDPQSPGLLVVMDGAWHQLGGLAEILEARVAISPDPSKPADEVTSYYTELGPDPIVKKASVSPLQDLAPDSQASFPDRSIQGPVGHYFDSSNSSANFLASSFILPSPTINPIKPRAGTSKDPRWMLAKLQFRRTLLKKTPTDGYSQDDNTGRFKDSVSSPYTPPVWAQYLPPFSIFEDVPLLGSSRNGKKPIRAQFQDGKIQLVDSSGNLVTLQSFPSDNSSFSLYAILTSRVVDITGRADQERYVGLFQPLGNVWIKIDPAGSDVSVNDTTGYRVRIIEVQRPLAAGFPGATLWDELFPLDDRDVHARIVRISEPVDSKRSDPCEGT